MSRRLPAAAVIILAAAAPGCGGDEPAPTTKPATSDTPTEPEPGNETGPDGSGADRRGSAVEGEPLPDASAPPPDASGSGDAGEEPEGPRIEVLLTARGGRIEPRVARVPAGVPITVELKGDEQAGALTIDGHELSPGGQPVTLDPLPAGSSYAGRSSSGARVEVSATAEPGP